MRRRRGYSFIELLLVLTFIGLLARMAVPRYRDMKVRAAAAAIVSNARTIQLAALTFYSERQAWPLDAPPGTVPPELVTYLPGGFPFVRPDHTFDYEVWPSSSGSGEIVAVTVTTSDAKLLQALSRIAVAAQGSFQAGNGVTFIFSALSGS